MLKSLPAGIKRKQRHLNSEGPKNGIPFVTGVEKSGSDKLVRQKKSNSEKYTTELKRVTSFYHSFLRNINVLVIKFFQ